MSGISKIMNNISVGLSLSGINKKNKSSNVSNPFGVSFKGHVYKADLFEASSVKNKLNFAAKLVSIKDNFINKMASIGHFVKSQTLSLGAKVVDFSNKIGEKTAGALTFKGKVSNNLQQNVSKDALKLARRPVAELEKMLSSSINAKVQGGV